MERKVSPLHFCLLGKDIKNEFECMVRVEKMVASYKLTLLNHFHVKYVIDKTNEQVDLGDYYHDSSTFLLIDYGL